MGSKCRRAVQHDGRAIRIYAATLLILLLTGCTASEGTATISDSPVPTPHPVATSPLPTPTVVPPSPLVVTLSLWLPVDMDPYADSPGAALLAQRLTDFGQAYPNLQVRVVVKEAEGRGGLMDFIRTASVAAPSVLPDLVVLDTASLRVATQQGLLQPMDDLLPTSLAGDRFPFASMLGDVDGQTMGATLAAELEHLAYWPGLVARPPLTWTAVISAESQLAFPAAGLEGGIHDFTLAQYLSAGGRLVSEEDSPQIDEGALAAVLSFYAQAISTGVISPTTILNLADTDECWEIFRSQEVGMAVVNSRRFWTDRELAALPAPLPAPNGGSLTLAEGWAIGLVTSNPDRQRQAMLLLEWLLAPEHSGPWTQASGYLPPTFSASQEWNVTEGEREVLEAILAGAISQPDPNTRAATAPAMQAALEDVLSGQRSPEDAAAEAADSFTP